MLEVFGQEVSSELRRVPNNKAVVRWTPRHNRVRRRVLHHVVRLAQKRRRRVRARNRCRRRRRHFSAASPRSLHFPIPIILNLNRKLKAKKKNGGLCVILYRMRVQENEKLKP